MENLLIYVWSLGRYRLFYQVSEGLALNINRRQKH